jgi:hypothetical protein
MMFVGASRPLADSNLYLNILLRLVIGEVLGDQITFATSSKETASYFDPRTHPAALDCMSSPVFLAVLQPKDHERIIFVQPRSQVLLTGSLSKMVTQLDMKGSYVE